MLEKIEMPCEMKAALSDFDAIKKELRDKNRKIADLNAKLKIAEKKRL